MASSRAPVRHQRRTSRRVPGQRSVAPRSARRTRASRYASRAPGQQRGRAEQHLAADRAREVHAEERQRRVGHGVDLPAHEVRAVGAQLQVRAAERDDPDVEPGAGARGQPVRPGPAAGDRARRVLDCTIRPQVQFDPVLAVDDRSHVDAGADLAAVGLDVAGVGRGDRGEVHDPGLRGVQRRQARGRGLDLAQLLRPDAAQAGHAVLARAALELVQPRQVRVAHRDDDLPAGLRGDPMVGAVGVQRVRALAAQPRLQRPGRVVDALVDDAAVVGGLVRAEPVLALEHEHAAAAQRERPRRGQADDPPADDRDVVRHESSRSSAAPTTDSASIWWCS